MKFLASVLALAQGQYLAGSTAFQVNTFGTQGSAATTTAVPYVPRSTTTVGASQVINGKIYTPSVVSGVPQVSTSATIPYVPSATTTFGVSAPASYSVAAGSQVNPALKGQPTPWITQTFNPSLFPQATTNVSLPGAPLVTTVSYTSSTRGGTTTPAVPYVPSSTVAAAATTTATTAPITEAQWQALQAQFKATGTFSLTSSAAASGVFPQASASSSSSASAQGSAAPRSTPQATTTTSFPGSTFSTQTGTQGTLNIQGATAFGASSTATGPSFPSATFTGATTAATNFPASANTASAATTTFPGQGSVQGSTTATFPSFPSAQGAATASFPGASATGSASFPSAAGFPSTSAGGAPSASASVAGSAASPFGNSDDYYYD